MSHVVQVQTQARDPFAIRAACGRLGLAEPVHGTFELFARQKATGLAVQLPGWRYPIVIDTAKGEIALDNFQGHWGENAQLDKFLQSYAIERATLEARKRGHSVTEQQLTDGSVKLTIQVAGGAA